MEDQKTQDKNILNFLEKDNSTIKRFVLDTSVILYDPESIRSFEDNEVIIPREVILELDKKRNESKEVGANAREAIRILKDIFVIDDVENLYRDYNPQVYLSNNKDDGGKVTLFLNYPDMYGYIDLAPDETEAVDTSEYSIFHYPGIEVEQQINNYAKHYTDFMIIQACRETESILVTKDILMMLFARQNGVPVEEYKKEQVDADELYKPTKNIFINQEQIQELYKKGEINTDKDLENNEYCIAKDYQQSSARVRYLKDKLYLCNPKKTHDLEPKNKEQSFALDSLNNKDIELVAITGPAGTGKTLLTIASGLEQVLNKETYNKFTITRPTVSTKNEDIGFLPGTLEEKARPWLQPIYDNIEFLYNTSNPNSIIAELKDRNKFDIQFLQFIRGRSIPKQYFVIDEAQNINPKQAKKIISRAGHGTKIVLTGDIYQIDNPYLNQNDNGLAHIIKKFKGQDNFSHINLIETERSRLAEQAAELL